MNKMDKDELHRQLIAAVKEGKVEETKTLLFKCADVNFVADEFVPDDWDSDAVAHLETGRHVAQIARRLTICAKR